MAWESRPNGRRYYVQLRKVKGRVQKTYIGTGPAAEAVAAEDARRRAEREARRLARHNEQARWEEACAPVAAYRTGLEPLLHAVLAAAGYHLHQRSQWRKWHHAPHDGQESCP